MSGEENSNQPSTPVPNQNSNALQLVSNPNVTSDSSRRTPRNMQGLLKFLLETTQNEDSAEASTLQPMEDERRQFLLKVFEGMSVNIIEKLADALKVISEVRSITEHDDPSAYENALDCIIDMVDEVDIANDFLKIGGLAACKPCLNSPHVGIRWRAAELIGECAQNNPNCQDNAVKLFFLNDLIKLVDNDLDERVRVKALYAISTIMRGNEKSLIFFHDIQACQALMRALQSNSDRLKIKVAFLLSTAFVQDAYLKSQLQKMGFITLLVQLTLEAVQENKLPSIEHYLGALMSLSKDLPDALEDCRQPSLNFADTLDNIIRTFKDNTACIEAVTYAKVLKWRVYSDRDLINADR